jgi:hypothetical protein
LGVHRLTGANRCEWHANDTARHRLHG